MSKISDAIERPAWKATEWLLRRKLNRDDAQEVLRWLHIIAESPVAWSAIKALVAAIRAGNVAEVMMQWEVVRRAVRE
jgi:hypothetical protein